MKQQETVFFWKVKTMNSIFIFIIWIFGKKVFLCDIVSWGQIKFFCNSYIVIVHISYFFMNTILWSPLCEISHKILFVAIFCFLQFKQTLQFHFTIVQFLKLCRYNETKLSVKTRTVTNFLWTFFNNNSKWKIVFMLCILVEIWLRNIISDKNQ